MEEIIGILIILLIPTAFIVGYFLEKKKQEKLYALFKPGMFLEYYTYTNHGKFKKEKLLLKYKILDTDGRYAWVKRVDGDTEYETEIDLYLDCQYQDNMTLKDAEGNIIRTFKFEL